MSQQAYLFATKEGYFLTGNDKEKIFFTKSLYNIAEYVKRYKDIEAAPPKHIESAIKDARPLSCFEVDLLKDILDAPENFEHMNKEPELEEPEGLISKLSSAANFLITTVMKY